jgi:hypothetical protein
LLHKSNHFLFSISIVKKLRTWKLQTDAPSSEVAAIVSESSFDGVRLAAALVPRSDETSPTAHCQLCSQLEVRSCKIGSRAGWARLSRVFDISESHFGIYNVFQNYENA